MTLAEFAATVAKLPLVAQLSSRWNYSVSTDVLCHLSEIISGQPYDTFLTGRLSVETGIARSRLSGDRRPSVAAGAPRNALDRGGDKSRHMPGLNVIHTHASE